MKQLILLLGTILMFYVSCSLMDSNPFFKTWDTPFGTPPFDEIKMSHYMPAFEKGMAIEKQEIETIVNNPETPTFENTIAAMEFSGELHIKVANVFYNMTGSMSDPDIEALSEELAPIRSAHRDDINLNSKLFERIKHLVDFKAELNLTPEQDRLLDEYYKGFVRAGALLNDSDKEKLREINEQLSVLTLRFSKNGLDETNRFELIIEDKNDLAGLPDAVISGASETAEEKGYSGKWIFTIHKPSLIPFLQYSERRELRERMFKAYANQGDQGDSLDNKDILKKVASLRVQRANLLGYETHAHYVLEENMAKVPDNVYKLLNQLWKPALKRAKMEARDLQKMIRREGHSFELKPWDWWYYAEKVKKDKFALDEEMLRPYLKLENVIQGAFDVATKLWGLTFNELDNIQIYHEDVKVFEVKDRDGSHIGILYTDYFPRTSKRGGAWMSDFRGQSVKNGEDIRPIIVNVGNFSKPTAGKPALISFEEVETLFHEFGHALHGLLSKVTYPSLSGTNVTRDFVELPSQIMENWASEPEVLKSYALHFETGEPMPDELIEKIRKSSLFNQGFATVEYLAASFLDMDWHTLTDDTEQEPTLFETASMDRLNLIPEIIPRYRSTYFRHIFSSPTGYSSGYYSYIWAEVLDADAFQAFKESSLFDAHYAEAYRKNILEAGNTADPMELYIRFRGSEPSIDALLKKRGLD